MPKNSVWLNGIEYQLITDKRGARQISYTMRPAEGQRQIKTVEWRVDGPDFFSHARLGQYLGRHYGANTDGRWEGVDCLGPLITVLDVNDGDNTHAASLLGTSTTLLGNNFFLGPAVEAPTASIGMALMRAQGAYYGWVARGQFVVRIKMSDLSIATSVILPAPATDIIATENAVITSRREVSVAMGATAYKTLKASDAVAPIDTWQTNSAGEPATKFGSAADRTVLLYERTAKGNIQKAAVTMTDPDWQDVATIANEDVDMSGFAQDGNLWLIGTTKGPYFLNADTGVFEPMMPEMDFSEDNCVGMTTWFPVGVIIPLQDGIRYSKGLSGESFGPERFLGNSSPAQGHVHGGAGSTRFFISPVHNSQTGNTYLIAWRPRESGDPHDKPLSPFIIAELSGVHSAWTKYVGTVNGERTNPTWFGGHGAGVYYMQSGRTSREIDDSNYRFAASGTTYLTELQLENIGDIESFEFFTDDCAAGKTVQLAVSIDKAAAVTVGSAITTEGFQRVLAVSAGVPQSTAHGGHFIRPEIRYTTDSSSVSPKVMGWLRMRYRERPVMLKVWSIPVLLPDNAAGKTSEDLEEELMARFAGGPVAWNDTDDPESASPKYGTVTGVKITEVEAGSGSEDTSHQVVRRADIVFEEWQTA